MSRTAAVVGRLMADPDECVAIAHADRMTYLRWDADAELVEAVEDRGGEIGERHHLAPHRIVQLLDAGEVAAWHPIGYFQATCNPEDRPEIEA